MNRLKAPLYDSVSTHTFCSHLIKTPLHRQTHTIYSVNNCHVHLRRLQSLAFMAILASNTPTTALFRCVYVITVFFLFTIISFTSCSKTSIIFKPNGEITLRNCSIFIALFVHQEKEVSEKRVIFSPKIHS